MVFKRKNRDESNSDIRLITRVKKFESSYSQVIFPRVYDRTFESKIRIKKPYQTILAQRLFRQGNIFESKKAQKIFANFFYTFRKILKNILGGFIINGNF